jgi:hypothetical protein
MPIPIYIVGHATLTHAIAHFLPEALSELQHKNPLIMVSIVSSTPRGTLMAKEM